MKKNKLKYNSVAALLRCVMEAVSGIILPRFILIYYGSATNGLISSVSQFLAVVSFLDMGTTAVVMAALYQPLADADQNRINQIISAANVFFRKIAYILIVYVLILCVCYPQIADSPLGDAWTALLIIIMAVGTFVEYYVGIVDQIFLSANQQEYIYAFVCTITNFLNLGCSIGIIYLGGSILAVKLLTAIIYLLRPIVARIYIQKKYTLNRKVGFDKNTIPQRWNGVAHHIAFRILVSTDTVILTMFSSMENVAVYAVYHMVLAGIDSLVKSLIKGVQPRIGLLWAEGKYVQVREEYRWYEWLYHMVIAFIYGCTLSLLVPFVMVYTNGVSDVNYERPLFSVLLTVSYAVLTMGQYGAIMIRALNHFKQTQGYYILSAVMNLGISVIMVVRFGLIGVTIGTLVAMLFQYGWTQWYMASRFFHCSIAGAVKQILMDAVIMVAGYKMAVCFSLTDYSYRGWIILGIKAAVVYAGMVIGVNAVCYPQNMRKLIRKKKSARK